MNAETGEWMAAIARVATVVYALSTSLLLVGAVMLQDWTGVAVAALTGFWAGGCYWLGFVHLANPEWKEGPPDGDAD